MTLHPPLTDPLAGLRATAALPLEEARGLPPECYLSPEVLAAEQARIFARDWICVGRADALPGPGDYLTCEIAGQPVLVIRGQDGVLRAMANVCLHRMSTMLQGSGHARSIVCPYHAWTYNSDGTLRGAPHMQGNRAFCRDQRLPQMGCEEWEGFVMVSLDPDAPPVAEGLAGLMPLIAPYGLAGYRQVFFERHRWNTNWKTLAENFMESYHLPACHAGTIGDLSDILDGEMHAGPGFNLHSLQKDAEFVLACAHPENRRVTGKWRRRTSIITIYPGLLLALTPGYFWYLSLLPDGPDHVAIGFGGGLAPEFCDDPAAERHFADLKQLLDDVNAEDRGCTERVFRGLSSPLARPGPLSPLERPIHDFTQYLASRLTGG